VFRQHAYPQRATIPNPAASSARPVRCHSLREAGSCSAPGLLAHAHPACVPAAGKRANSNYWKGVASKLDVWARVVVPSLYVFCLLAIFHLDLTDDYETDPTSEMFNGLGPRQLSDRGVKSVLVYFCVIVTCALCGYIMHRFNVKEDARRQAKYLEVSSTATDEILHKLKTSRTQGNNVHASSSSDSSGSVARLDGVVSGGPPTCTRRRVHCAAVEVEGNTNTASSATPSLYATPVQGTQGASVSCCEVQVDLDH
jgi:hypothetical protein